MKFQVETIPGISPFFVNDLDQDTNSALQEKLHTVSFGSYGRVTNPKAGLYDIGVTCDRDAFDAIKDVLQVLADFGLVNATEMAETYAQLELGVNNQPGAVGTKNHTGNLPRR